MFKYPKHFTKSQIFYIGNCTAKKKILTLKNFNNLLSSLPSSNFIRVQRSYIVGINKISSIERNHILIGEKLIPIGPTFKDAFFNTLKNRNLI